MKIGERQSGWVRKGILRIDVEPGYVMPWGYGFCYLDWQSGIAITYPFPINYFISIVRTIWYRVRDVPFPELSKAYSDGYMKGFQDGKAYKSLPVDPIDQIKFDELFREINEKA